MEFDIFFNTERNTFLNLLSKHSFKRVSRLLKKTNNGTNMKALINNFQNIYKNVLIVGFHLFYNF